MVLGGGLFWKRRTLLVLVIPAVTILSSKIGKGHCCLAINFHFWLYLLWFIHTGKTVHVFIYITFFLFWYWWIIYSDNVNDGKCY